MSTHGCFATFFPYTIAAIRWRRPGDSWSRRWLLLPQRSLLLHGDRRPGVVRRPQAGGLRLFDLVVVVLFSLLKANLSNYVYTQILLLSLTYVFRSSWPLVCNITPLCLNLCLELCCDIFPWVSGLDRACLRIWLVHGRVGGITTVYSYA